MDSMSVVLVNKTMAVEHINAWSKGITGNNLN